MEDTSLIELLKRAQGDRTLNAYARHADVSAGNLSRIMNGQKPSPEILKKLSDKAHNGITYEELMNAAGYISDVNPIISKELNKSFHSKLKVPILGRIRAGLPLLATENWEAEVEVAADLSADFALRVVGDSMSWVGINDGDLAILRQANTAYNGDIIACGVQDGDWCATLKFFINENGTPLLRAANPNYADMPITSNHRIIGNLVSIQKEVPSLNTYKNFLTSKELSDEHWNEVIEKATQIGLDNRQVIKLMELFSDMVKHVK